MDESTDCNDINQMVVFAKMVKCNEEIVNQPFGLMPLLTTTPTSETVAAGETQKCSKEGVIFLAEPSVAKNKS